MSSVAANHRVDPERHTASVLLRGEGIRRVSRPRDWTEDELVRRMIAGEDPAWREFLVRYEKLIRSLIWRLMSRFSSVAGRGEADDIYADFLQSLLLKDNHKLRCFDSGRGSSLGTWVGMLATNAAWDHLRRVARHSRCAKELVQKVELKVGADPLVALVAKETSRSIQQALGQLSEKDQTLVRLFYVVGLPPEEIAVVMNISIKTVYSKKHKINTRLQQAF